MKSEKLAVKHDWAVIMPEVRKRQAEGMTIAAIAEELGVTTSALRYKLNPRPDRPMKRAKRDAKLRALKANIPKDTRTPGQILMGEPVRERSALYKKQQEGEG